MAKRHVLMIAAVCLLLLAFSRAALLAQTETPTAVPPPVFTDGRVNDNVNLGGLAIYCVDQSNNTHVTSFQNGAITVWGIGDQKYMNLSAAQLAGNVEVPQPPSEMEMQMTQTAPAATMQSAEVPTEAPGAVMQEVTPNAAGQTPVLLARATTPNGEIAFFRVDTDQFALQGHDNNGLFFTYTWSGCAEGVLDQTTAPYLPELAVTATVVFPAFETPQVTPEMTMGA